MEDGICGLNKSLIFDRDIFFKRKGDESFCGFIREISLTLRYWSRKCNETLLRQRKKSDEMEDFGNRKKPG